MKKIIFIFLVVFSSFANAQSNRCGGTALANALQAAEPKTQGCVKAQTVFEALTDPSEIEKFSDELRALGSPAIVDACTPTSNTQAIEVSGQICGANQGKTCYFVSQLNCKFKNKKFPMAMQGGCQSNLCGSFSSCLKDLTVDTNEVVFKDVPKTEPEAQVRINPATGVVEIRQ